MSSVKASIQGLDLLLAPVLPLAMFSLSVAAQASFGRLFAIALLFVWETCNRCVTCSGASGVFGRYESCACVLSLPCEFGRHAMSM